MSIDIAAEVTFRFAQEGEYLVHLQDADRTVVGKVFRWDGEWRAYTTQGQPTGRGNTRYLAARGLLEAYELANGLRDSEGRRVGHDPEVLGFWCVLGFEGTRQSERWTDRADAIAHLASLQTPAVKTESNVVWSADNGWHDGPAATVDVDDHGRIVSTPVAEDAAQTEIVTESDTADGFCNATHPVTGSACVNGAHGWGRLHWDGSITTWADEDADPEPLPQVVIVWKDGTLTTGLDSLRRVLERPESSELDFKLYVAQDGSLVEATTRGLSASTDADEWIHQRIALLVGETVIHTLVLRIDGRA